MRPRNTISPDNHTNTPISRQTFSLDRPSISTVSHVPSSSIKGPIYDIEALTQSIFASQRLIGRSHLGNRQSTYTKTIKNDGKTVVNLVSNFLSVLDTRADPPHIQIENVPEIFKMLKYPGNVTRNIINPVGAKHTWGQLLSMISWLGQLASYYSKAEEKLANRVTINWDLEKIFVEGFRNKRKLDTEKLMHYYSEKKANLKKTLNEIKYEKECVEIAISSVLSSQKDLSWAEEELKKVEQIENRQMNEIIIAENQIKDMQRMIFEQESSLKDIQFSIEGAKLEQRKILRQIESQTSTVEEVQKMQEQISDSKIRSAEIENQLNLHRESYKQDVYNLTAQFHKQKTKFEARVEGLRRMYVNTEQNDYELSSVVQEFPVNFNLLKEYFTTSVSANSPMLDQIFVSNKHQKISEIKKLSSNMMLLENQMKRKIEEAQKNIREREKMNMQAHKQTVQNKLKLEQKKSAIMLKKEQRQTLSAQIMILNTQNHHLQNMSVEKQRTFTDLMKKIAEAKEVERQTIEKIARVKAEGEQIYANSVACAKLVVKKINEDLKETVKEHKELGDAYFETETLSEKQE